MKLFFQIYQGERPLVAGNHYLNKCIKVPVPPAPAGCAEVLVTFDLSADGLLTVTCVEPSTGERKRATIDRSEAALSQQDIDDMIEKADRYRREDQEATEKIVQMLRRQRLC